MKKTLFIGLLCFLALISSLFAQRGFGVRFSSNFNYFHGGRNDVFFPLTDGWYSTGGIGPYYRAYNSKGGYEIGVSAFYKNNTGRGFPNIPVVMRDYNKDYPQNVGITAIETELRVGPRLWNIVEPKIGYMVGYYFKNAGFTKPDTLYANIPMNRFYVNLPFGCSVTLPTSFGTVGFGASYLVGLLNVMKKPEGWEPSFNEPSYEGGKNRSINFSVTMTFSTENQRFRDDEIEERIKKEEIERQKKLDEEYEKSQEKKTRR